MPLAAAATDETLKYPMRKEFVRRGDRVRWKATRTVKGEIEEFEATGVVTNIVDRCVLVTRDDRPWIVCVQLHNLRLVSRGET